MDSTADIKITNEDIEVFVVGNALRGVERLRSSIGDQGLKAEKNKYPKKILCGKFSYFLIF